LTSPQACTRDQKKHIKKVCGALSFPTTTDIKKNAQKEKKKTKKTELRKKKKLGAADPVFDLTLSLKTTGHRAQVQFLG